MLWVHFGKNKEEVILCTKFPKTKFKFTWTKRIIEHEKYEKVVEVQFSDFAYKEKYDWDFKAELAKMIYDKSVEQIERIAEQLEII